MPTFESIDAFKNACELISSLSANQIITKIKEDTKVGGLDFAMNLNGPNDESTSLLDLVSARVGKIKPQCLLYGIDGHAKTFLCLQTFQKVVETALQKHHETWDAMHGSSWPKGPPPARHHHGAASFESILDLAALFGVTGDDFVGTLLREMSEYDFQYLDSCVKKDGRPAGGFEFPLRTELLAFLAPTNTNIIAVGHAIVKKIDELVDVDDEDCWFDLFCAHSAAMQLFGWFQDAVDPFVGETIQGALARKFDLDFDEVAPGLEELWERKNEYASWPPPYPFFTNRDWSMNRETFFNTYPPFSQVVSFYTTFLGRTPDRIFDPLQPDVMLDKGQLGNSAIYESLKRHTRTILRWIRRSKGRVGSMDFIQEAFASAIDMPVSEFREFVEEDEYEDAHLLLRTYRTLMAKLFFDLKVAIAPDTTSKWLDVEDERLTLDKESINKLMRCHTLHAVVTRWRKVSVFVKCRPIVLRWVEETEKRACCPTGPARRYHDASNKGDEAGRKRARDDLVEHYAGCLRRTRRNTNCCKGECCIHPAAEVLAEQRIKLLG